MILDILEHGPRYLGIHQSFAKAFEFLSRPDLTHLEPGEYGIDGDFVYAIVAKEQGRSKEDGQLEIHERFIDIQLVLAGVETMGWLAKSSCQRPAGVYNPEGDIQFFDDRPGSWIAVRPGTFAVFFPEDAHLPLVATGEIHKIVVKIAMIGS